MPPVENAVVDPRAPRRTLRTRLSSAAGSGLLAVAAVVLLAAVLLAAETSTWATSRDWLLIAALVPGGVAGALLGDRFGSWLQGHRPDRS